MDKRLVGAVGAAALLLAGCGTVAGAGGAKELGYRPGQVVQAIG